MNPHRLVVPLTALNLALFLATAVVAYTLTRPSTLAAAHEVHPILRARLIELVDDGGQVRSSLKVEPEGEVLLRLFDPRGTIRVKLGAGEDGSGLMLADETTEPGVHLIARRQPTATRPNTTALTLTGAGGQQVLRP